MKKKLLLCFSFILFTLAIHAQIIPNASFENWTSTGTYSNPDGWDQLNSLTAAGSIFTCEQGNPGTVGSFYLKLTSRNTGISGIVLPGVAVSGFIDIITQQPKSGFAFSGQPQALTGKWQHMIFGNSQGYIDVKLTKWNSATNSRTIVANGHVDLTGMAMSWANFNIPLLYSETFAPDSCLIVLSSSGSAPTNNDYLWVDELAFTGNVTTLFENYNSSKFSFFPNPSASILTIDLSAFSGNAVNIKIYDMIGNEILNQNMLQASFNSTLDINHLAKGNYVLQILSNDQIFSKQFIKN